MNQDISRLRLAAINLLVLSLLATLVARLWFLQVLAGDDLRAQARQTSVRIVSEEAPRGFIYDRKGKPLARNRTALTVALDVSQLREGELDAVLPKLASVLGMPEEQVRKAVTDPRGGDVYTPKPVAQDVEKDVVIYLLEHRDEFPGVVAQELPIREYPEGTLAAHVIGHIGAVSRDELDAEVERPLDGCAEAGRAASEPYLTIDKTGKIGVERTYERWLRGYHGQRKILVNVRGQQVRNLGTEPPLRGCDAVLTLDADLQRQAEDALQRGIELARRLTDPDTGRRYKAPAGAVVALDPRNGEVLALASNPTFDPNLFVGSPPAEAIAALNHPDAGKPMFNRAISEAAPPGSTFKVITAAAAWDAGITNPQKTYNCPGSYKIGNRTFRDFSPEGHGTVGLRRSLVESCDVAYYILGTELNALRDRKGEHLQAVARLFGLGERTGIDLIGEHRGLVPDARWKEDTFSRERPYDRRWFPGDSANLAVGQGFLQVTPLQLAVAYAALSNGGTLYRPHVLKCLTRMDAARPAGADEACRGGVVPEGAMPYIPHSVSIPPSALAYIADALTGVGMDDGTAAAAFSGFDFARVPVAGKTGTAQVIPRQPFSWFAAFAPVNDPQIVVVALVEEGGTGAEIAAPVVRRVLENHFGLPEGDFVAGARAD